jgi:hypothetical protein
MCTTAHEEEEIIKAKELGEAEVVHTSINMNKGNDGAIGNVAAKMKVALMLVAASYKDKGGTVLSIQHHCSGMML